ncbi:MAG: sulfatase [Planctomycetaceae bacterium]|nr:sulfatase [Planctomycetaceae bacterium]
MLSNPDGQRVPSNSNRRQLLKAAACGFGHVALLGLAEQESVAENTSPQELSAQYKSALEVRRSHFPAKAKRVIFLFIHGGVSHVDSFDPKPKLAEMNGKPVPFAKPDFEFAVTGNLLKSPWTFRNYGESGIPVSDLFPEIGSCVDDIAVIRSMENGNQVSHGPAALALHTGDGVFHRPSMGAWIVYGLGSENQDLPGFVTLSPSNYHGGSQNYGSAFLPASYQATRIGDGHSRFKQATFDNLASKNPDLQRKQLDLLKRLNKQHQESRSDDSRLAARILSYELTFRMQMEAPLITDLARESKSTFELYGIDKEPTDEFGRQCLSARRMSEAGVRFVHVNHSYPRNYWDAHGRLRANHSSNAKKIDKPIAALLRDLKQRGLLDETLVVWGTEFGRTPAAQGRDGRDHHPHAFSLWMAGGGIKGGITHGATDEFGYYVAENKVSMHDLHATILHQLGLNHEELTYRYAGRDFRLTDVEGEVVKDILA